MFHDRKRSSRFMIDHQSPKAMITDWSIIHQDRHSIAWSMPLLLMSWWRKEPGHQQPCLPSSLWYKAHTCRQLNCWSLRCSWSTAYRRCSNYIFILHLTPGFNMLRKDNCKPSREAFELLDLMRLILEITVVNSEYSSFSAIRASGWPLWPACFSTCIEKWREIHIFDRSKQFSLVRVKFALHLKSMA